jgi:uncharacterized protein YndB with AHSA1/START domain
MATDEISLTVERVIPGPIDQVFDAWLNPDQLQRWMTPVPRATVDPRVGGRFHITMGAQGREIAHDGEYRVIDRPNRLVFTWISEPAGRSLVTVEFQKLDERSTRIALTHEQLPSAKARDSHRGGWTGILEAMARAFGG